MRSRARAVVLSFAVLVPSVLYALSPEYEEWRVGPVQWIMTPEEQGAWRGVKTEAQAIRFIDLFWARRDPTRGTPRNEYREEFDRRVAYSDLNFEEHSKRGALTDRGRVYVILGHPTRMDKSLATQQGGGIQGYGTSERSMWFYERADAEKYGMAKIDAFFVGDFITKSQHLDPNRPDFLAAAPNAQRLALANAELTEVPEWALHGGLRPFVPKSEVEKASAPKPKPDDRATPAPILPPVQLGASKLTLVRDDVYSLQLGETSVDPFTTLHTVDSFRADQDLGWLEQYCNGKPEAPTLRFSLKLMTEIGGQKITRSTEPDEMMPDRIKALPGCYLLRGGVPLAGNEKGDYTLELTIEDPDTGEHSTQQRTFRIEE